MDDPDWSHLPSDLIISIARNLTMYSDYIRFRGVCWGWRSSLPPVPCHLPVQFPWLMFSQGRRRGFYDPLSRKIHLLNLPDASHPRRICCSSKGWLVVLEEGPNILCLNPLTRAKVYLPPLSSFPNVTAFDFSNVGREFAVEDQSGNVCTRNLKQMRDSFLKKIVLSESPDSANGADFVAMSMVSSYSGSGDLAFCKKGDASWKFILPVPGTTTTTTTCFYEDVVYWNGFFYGVASTGHVSVIDVTDGDHPRVIQTLSPSGIGIGGDLQYLVHSGDRLLLVCRRLELEVPDYESVFQVYETTNFEVYWLNESIPKWELVDNLESHVLFLGKNTSFSLQASDFPGCNGNRVYFTDDHSEYNYDVDVDVAPPCYDMGIFNLTDDSIEKLPYFVQSSSTASALPAPMWVSPNPC